MSAPPARTFSQWCSMAGSSAGSASVGNQTAPRAPGSRGARYAACSPGPDATSSTRAPSGSPAASSAARIGSRFLTNAGDVGTLPAIATARYPVVAAARAAAALARDPSRVPAARAASMCERRAQRSGPRRARCVAQCWQLGSDCERKNCDALYYMYHPRYLDTVPTLPTPTPPPRSSRALPAVIEPSRRMRECHAGPQSGA